MRHTRNQFIALGALALPLAVTLGCAGTESQLSATQQEEYLAHYDAPEMKMETEIQAKPQEQEDALATPESESRQSTAQHAPESTTFDTLAAIYQYEIEQAPRPLPQPAPQFEGAEAALQDVAAAEPPFTTVAEHEEQQSIAATLPIEETQESMAAESGMGEPQRKVVHFGFDSHDIDNSDISDLKQHARYLLHYPHLTLVISGHTDSFGPRSYNQRLSERRAQSVAALLLAEGVPQSQIQINALADAVPVTDPDHYRENRRVELTYQDSMLVSNQ